MPPLVVLRPVTILSFLLLARILSLQRAQSPQARFFASSRTLHATPPEKFFSSDRLNIQAGTAAARSTAHVPDLSSRVVCCVVQAQAASFHLNDDVAISDPSTAPLASLSLTSWHLSSPFFRQSLRRHDGRFRIKIVHPDFSAF